MCHKLLQQNISEQQQPEEIVERHESVLSVDRPENIDIVHVISACGAGNTCRAVKTREDVMSARNYCAAMRLTNQEQRSLLLEVIDSSQLPNKETIRVFLTGPAGCGKTFTVDLSKHAYNRLYTSPGCASNAYVTMATKGKPLLLSEASPYTWRSR
ncbi:hypothetical protein MRX96_045939 [Rhipicephalus microplus]